MSALPAVTGTYSFAHRTLLEYFAAKGLVDNEAWMDRRQLSGTCGVKLVGKKLIRFAASMTRTPEKLLKAIKDETGPARTPDRPLQRLDTGFLTGAWVIAFVGFDFNRIEHRSIC